MAIAVGTGLLLRAAKGYRSFPSIDDFIYIPHARACIDPSLFPRDTVLQQMVDHVPLWPPLIRLLDGSLGLSLGLWLLTILLSIATTVAMMRLIRALGGSGLLLPIAALAVFAAKMVGLGRGTYDGAFGDAFHMQWAALALLLFVYDAVLRQRFTTAGVLLGITAICHPVVAAHGALAVTCSAPFWEARPWRNLAIVAGLAFLVSCPVSISIVAGVLTKSSSAGSSAVEIANLCYLYRVPHEYVIPHNALLLYLIYTSLGLAGTSVLAERSRATSEQTRCGTLAGLIVGHVVLLAAAVVFHGESLGTVWRLDTLLPFQLHLTRTTPLLLVLSAVAMAAAFEREILEKRKGEEHHLRWGRLVFWVPLLGIGAILLFVGTVWTEVLIGLALLAILTIIAGANRASHRSLALLWCGAAVFALIWFDKTSTRDVHLVAVEEELYDWVRNDTATDALFIIPPGMQSFRYYALRSVYMDYKFFPSSAPPLLREWRLRLEQVAAPDAVALKERGVPAVWEWDRTYANRNTPTRIAELLDDTGADYFVYDRKALERPPYVPVEHPDDPRVKVCFENDRFSVYCRQEARP